MWPLSLLIYIGFPLHMPSFSGPKWSMIYMKCFSVHHMPCFPMLSLSLPMTWLHLSYPVYIIWIFCMPCFSFRTEWSVMMGLLLCTCFFPGTNMLHEWNDFPIWHDYLFLLCTRFFSRNKHVTWMKWLSYMTWLSLSSMHMLFSRNKHATWMIWLPIWHD